VVPRCAVLAEVASQDHQIAKTDGPIAVEVAVGECDDFVA
jgi:hypothetical protein